MSRQRLFFLAFLVVMIGLAVVVGRQSGDNLIKLQAEGFNISYDFNGVPRLLVDEAQQQIAVVERKTVTRLSFAQISKIDIAFDGQADAPVNYRIEIFSEALANGRIAVIYENEWRAKQEFSRFRTMISH